MMSRLVMALVVVSALAVATRAEAVSSIGNPVPGTACASMDVASQMNDPNVFSVSGSGIKAGQCAFACRIAAVECMQTAKVNWGCQVTVLERGFTFLAEGCVVDNAGIPKSIKSCIQSGADATKTARLNLRSSLRLDLAGCETWGASCLNDCALLPR